MDISIYFEPIDFEPAEYSKGSLGDTVNIYRQKSSFPELDEVEIALIGVADDRGAIGNQGCSGAPDVFRKYFYALFQGYYNAQIVDLGNIMPGNVIEDTYFALSTTITELIKKGVTPVVIGGGQDLTYSNYKAYDQLEQVVNMVMVDNQFNLGEVDQPLDSDSFLSKIILHQPNILFNYANIGYQTYFVNQDALELMNKLYFDAYRLGEVRSDMQEVEPIVRNADMMSFDVGAIRMSDAPGNANSTPNGFYGEEACQIARYAGMSDKLTSVGFYEMNPVFDNKGRTAHLLAQIVWYFIDGYYSRKKDYPMLTKTDFVKYRVNVEEGKHELVFYKSKKSDRWWMDIPYPLNKGIKYERHHLVPCSYADYEIALKEEMPDRWWKTYQKLS